MSWTDGVKNFFSNFNATPRMGPLGYILGSAYSPLVLERDMPDRNWRDAYEDLLALDTGGKMVPDAHRKAEDAYAAKERYDYTCETISMCNTLLREWDKIDDRFEKYCKLTWDVGGNESYGPLGDRVRSMRKKDTENIIAHAKNTQLEYETVKDMSASSQKSHGQWITSLISSGALPGWRWDEHISVDGPLMRFARTKAPPELAISFTMTEKELSEQFVHGQPQKIGLPLRLPPARLQALRDGVIEAPRSRIGPQRLFVPSLSSTLMQIGTTESFKRPDGSRSTKVIIKNQLVNGRIVEKKYLQQPAKVLEEIVNARKSMARLKTFFVEGPQVDPLDEIDSINQVFDDMFADFEGDPSLA
ncbi:MAG: hypothetical protein LQ337_005901 [Flavoplaca oasis]|nr:MAG: hypothetical protein LQ337_005901 [Flavoplaca oasis]